MKKKLKTNPRTLVEDEISRSLSREDSPLDSLEVWLDWDSWPWCMAVAPRTAPKNGASGARLKNLVKSWFSDSSRLVLQEMVLLGFWKWCDKLDVVYVLGDIVGLGGCYTGNLRNKKNGSILTTGPQVWDVTRGPRGPSMSCSPRRGCFSSYPTITFLSHDGS